MSKKQPITLEEIISAFQTLGGQARVVQIQDIIRKQRGGKPEHYLNDRSFEQTIQAQIEDHSPQSYRYRGRPFFEKIGWGLYKLLLPISPKTPVAIDIGEPVETQRVQQEVYRILRDTQLSRDLKVLYKFKCQICGIAINLSNGEQYAEVHHIKPLGSPHNGPDVIENILCVCPNHHVQLDYGAIRLNKSDLHLESTHSIAELYIQYHNDKIFKK